MKLAIAVPALDHVSAIFANDLTLLYAYTREAYPYPDKITLAMVTGTFVHQAREKLLHDVTELWRATHILWLDADMTFPPDTALRLIRHEKEVVAANYCTRRPPYRPTAKKDGQCVSSAEKSGLESVDHVGMGAFLMRAEIVKHIAPPHFWYSTLTETEDVFFCRQLRAANHEIWIDHDLSREVGHVGQYTYREQSSMVAV